MTAPLYLSPSPGVAIAQERWIQNRGQIRCFAIPGSQDLMLTNTHVGAITCSILRTPLPLVLLVMSAQPKPIQRLSENLINRIAAGEVSRHCAVERR